MTEGQSAATLNVEPSPRAGEVLPYSRRMQIRREVQQAAVADEVSAIVAVVRPILIGLLYAQKGQVVEEAGGHEHLKLFMLARVRRAGDGDIGICFEYAVHEAIGRRDPAVCGRVADALTACRIPGDAMASILFGAEKTGALSLVDTASALLTPDSILLYGTAGRPVKLRKHISAIATAFRTRDSDALPRSIRGLWKADLFTGNAEVDKWIGTTLKLHRQDLEGARGLRVGIVPSRQGASDAVVKDDNKNLVICPLPYDYSFMQVFYEAWEVVASFLSNDARVPAPHFLATPYQRQVARFLEARREFTVLEVVEGLAPLAQPHLLETDPISVSLVERRTPTETAAVLAPVPMRPVR